MGTPGFFDNCFSNVIDDIFIFMKKKLVMVLG